MGAPAVQRLTETIQDAAREIWSHRHLGVLPAGDNTVVQLNAIDLFQRHRKHMAIPEADYLGANAAAARRDHFAKISHRHSRSAGSNQHTD